MGIRAVGFLKMKDMTEINAFLNKFRDGLFALGSFGFDTWHCYINQYYYMSGNQNNSNSNNSLLDAVNRLITFSDTNKIIVGYSDGILISDSSFNGFLNDIGLTKNIQVCQIEGAMAQLGDFKVRYGAVNGQVTPGILFDIEYLPVSLLSSNFKPLFDSVVSMMTESSQTPIELILPDDPNAEFTYKHLGQLYFQIKDLFPA